MNRELYDQANKELTELLDKCPELIPLQIQIMNELDTLDSPAARCYYIQEVMLDKLEELKCKLVKVESILQHIQTYS